MQYPEPPPLKCPHCGEDFYVINPKSYDHARQLVRTAAGRSIHLTKTEVSIFETLFAAKGDWVRGQELVDSTNRSWENIRLRIHYLRKKLTNSGITIRTLWGHGYRLEFNTEETFTDDLLAQ